MKQLIKRLLTIALKEYDINRIYRLQLTEARTKSGNRDASMVDGIARLKSMRDFAASSDPRIRDHAWFMDRDAYAYGIYDGADLVAVCIFWKGQHPKMPERLAPLSEKDAVLVDLLTAQQHRGKGYALALARFGESDLLEKGYDVLWAWVWHSNTPSIRVFNKAGWTYSHLLFECKIRGFDRRLSMKLPAWGAIA